MNRRLVVVSLIGTCVVVEIGAEVGAQRIQVRRPDARDVAAHGLGSCIRQKRCSWLRQRFILEVGKEEQPVRDYRPAQPTAEVLELELSRIERQVTCLLANESLIAE